MTREDIITVIPVSSVIIIAVVMFFHTVTVIFFADGRVGAVLPIIAAKASPIKSLLVDLKFHTLD